MKPFRTWAAPARYFTLTVVFLLLTIGLCSYGTGFEQHDSTHLQDVSAWVGIVTFLGFIVCLIATAGSALAALVNRSKR